MILAHVLFFHRQMTNTSRRTLATLTSKLYILYNYIFLLHLYKFTRYTADNGFSKAGQALHLVDANGADCLPLSASSGHDTATPFLLQKLV